MNEIQAFRRSQRLFSVKKYKNIVIHCQKTLHLFPLTLPMHMGVVQYVMVPIGPW